MAVVDDSYEGDTDTTPLLQRGVSRRDVLKSGLAVSPLFGGNLADDRAASTTDHGKYELRLTLKIGH